MTKYFVIALVRAFADPDLVEPGTIVSSHLSLRTAEDAARKLDSKAKWSKDKRFAGIESENDLVKGNCYPELVQKYLDEKFDADAMHTMKCILDPTWQGGRPVTDEQIGWLLEDLDIPMDMLRIRFEERARAELDAMAVNKVERAEQKARVHAVANELAARRSEITYSFPAVRGIQAGQAYYVAQVPYSALVKLFVFDDDVVPAQHRAQRMLNESRAVKIADYIEENPVTYVLPALTASVSSEMAFEPMAVSGAADRLGLLHIPVEATMLINDGQHRRRGIELAIAKLPGLRDETIAVAIFFDQGLARSQQMFADINGKQVKPSNAINALYDRRNPFNAWTLSIMDILPEIGQRIDVENSSVGAKSYKLWSLIAFKKFISILTGVTEKNIDNLENDDLVAIDAFIERFFSECREHIPKWRVMIDGDLSAFDVRETLVIGHTVWLEALAVFARRALFYGNTEFDPKAPVDEGVIVPAMAMWERMESLTKIDPARNSRMWAGRCVVLGKMQKTSDGVKGSALRMLRLANVHPSNDLIELEKRLENKLAA